MARRVIVALVGLLALLPADACASGGPQLYAAFTPNQLGANTTITMGFRIRPSAGVENAPLAKVELRLPAGATAGFNTLGTATCAPSRLERAGPGDCSPNSVLGRGKAVVSVPFGSESIFERVNMSIFMAPANEGHTAMAFYAHGTSPVISQLVFQGLLRGAGAPFGAAIDTAIPTIAGIPESPAAALISMQVEIAPKGLRYYRRVHGVIVPYRPAGFDVPTTCPHGGFPFAATFTFVDGSTETAASKAPCPRARA